MKQKTAVTKIFTVNNKMGVHARPAAMIVQIANKYPKLDIQIEKDKESVNGKSIMGVMMLAAGQGSKLNFIVEGPSPEKFFKEMEDLFKRQFEET